MEVASHHHEEHHVHFRESDDKLKENEIVVRKRLENYYEIQLGFLQINHTYEVTVDLGADFVENLDLESYAQKEVPVPVHCKFISLERRPGSCLLKFQFKALHDKVTKEKMILAGDTREVLEFEVVARVLGKGKGTPMLRDGIRSIAVEHSDETEESDWKGF